VLLCWALASLASTAYTLDKARDSTIARACRVLLVKAEWRNGRKAVGT